MACQKKHPLDKCESIMEKPLDKRTKILRNGKFCYRCLKPMAKDHNAILVIQQYSMVVPKVKTDNSESTTNSECSSKNAAEQENVMCASVNGKFNVEVISMCVVPIQTSHKNCKKTIRTYAVLDNCSRGSFIK